MRPADACFIDARAVRGPLGPDDLLGWLLRDLLDGVPVNAASREWMVAGILRAIRRSESLDSVLQLSGPGREPLQRRLLRARRDLHLLQALESVSLDPAVTSWAKCVRLAAEIRRFDATWQRNKRRKTAPTEWPAFKRHLWDAAATDIPLPTSAHALRWILVTNQRTPHNKRGSTLLARFV